MDDDVPPVEPDGGVATKRGPSNVVPRQPRHRETPLSLLAEIEHVETMKIGALKFGEVDHRRTCTVDVDSARGRETLWFSVPEAYGHFLARTSDAFLAALLIPAMASGEDIHIEGAISERLFYTVSRSLQVVLCHMLPSLRPVRVHPMEVRRGVPSPARGVATGFSGGIDSYCALADHHYGDVPGGFRITHLLFNNVGSHGRGGEHLFRRRHERLVPAARRIGLPFLSVDSNLDGFYPKGLGIQQTHTLRNASVALLLQGGIERFLYASAYDYRKVFVGPARSAGYTDPVTLPLLSTEAIDILASGSEWNRVQKTLRVAELEHSHDSLDVCVSPEHQGVHANCSQCWKCLRTLATLEIGGCLERYAASFDLDTYRSRKTEYLAALAGSEDPFQQEILHFAQERGFPLPAPTQVPSPQIPSPTPSPSPRPRNPDS